MKKCYFLSVNFVLWGILASLGANLLIAKGSEFYYTGENITVGWTNPDLSSKKPLSYGLGYVEGYQEGYTTGYDCAYNKKTANDSIPILVKNNDKSEYLQGVREGFKKGYQDGFDKGDEDYQRWVEKKWDPEKTKQKQVRVWKYQWGYFGGYWYMSDVYWVKKSKQI